MRHHSSFGVIVPYYGYVAPPNIGGVADNWKKIELITRAFPYPKYRKFRTHEEAVEFVKRYKGKEDRDFGLYNYGSTFKRHYVHAQYFFGEDSVYINIFNNGLGHISYEVDDHLIVKDEKADVAMFEIKHIKLNPVLVTSHALAIFYILKIVGDFLDVCIDIPSRGIFFMLNSYTGKDDKILKMLALKENRLGEVSVNLETW